MIFFVVHHRCVLLLVACLFFYTLNFLFDILLRDSLAILGFTKQRGMVNFLLSMRDEHFLLRYVLANMCWSRFLLTCPLNKIISMSLRNPSAVLDSPRPGRIMNFRSSVCISFIIDHLTFIHHRSPCCRPPSTIATPRYHSQPTPALAFTIDRCAFIHHRPQRFHLGLICSVRVYVKFLSKGNIKSWYICGHEWTLSKRQTHLVLIYTAVTAQK